MGQLIIRFSYLSYMIREGSFSIVSGTLARRTRGWYVEESYVQIDHVRTWSRDRMALVFWIRQPYRKMKRIIASPRLCTLLDISVHRALDSDILMPKGSTTDPDMYRRYLRLYMQAHVYVYMRCFRAPNMYSQSLWASSHHRRRASLRFAWYVCEIGSSDLKLILRGY